MRPIMAIVAAAVLCVAVPACGSKVIVEGKLSKGGNAVPGPSSSFLSIEFQLIEGDDLGGSSSFPANIKRAGEFVVRGHDGKGIPQGKYRISVQVTNKDGSVDYLEGKFAPETSPIVRDIDGSFVEIDLDKPSG